MYEQVEMVPYYSSALSHGTTDNWVYTLVWLASTPPGAALNISRFGMIPLVAHLTSACNTENQAQQRMHTFAGQPAFALSILGGNTPEETLNADHSKTRHTASPGDSVGLQKARSNDVSDDVDSEKRSSKSFVRGSHGGSDDAVIRSPVMLEFGAEVPPHAASTCGRAVQLPIPDTWEETEVRDAVASPYSVLLLFVFEV